MEDVTVEVKRFTRGSVVCDFKVIFTIILIVIINIVIIITIT